MLRDGDLAVSHLERHENRVGVAVRAEVVALAKALTLEAERLVERDRRLVPREDVKLELRHAMLRRPLDSRLEQRSADALPPEARVDHQAEVGDVVRRGVGVARK